MADKLTPLQRSKNMASIKSKNTKPELLVRRVLWGLGYRYRLHLKVLPGKPDLVLSKYKTVIFVNGCFWHGHTNCKDASKPKTNSLFWADKLTRNVERDRRNTTALVELGWKVIVIWDCELYTNRSQIKEYILERLIESGIGKISSY